jgi:hypothetical protein
MSKVVRFHEHGGAEQLRIEELDVGGAGGEVRIRVKAIGLPDAEKTTGTTESRQKIEDLKTGTVSAALWHDSYCEPTQSQLEEQGCTQEFPNTLYRLF